VSQGRHIDMDVQDATIFAAWRVFDDISLAALRAMLLACLKLSCSDVRRLLGIVRWCR